MSYSIGRQAINLEMPERVAHTEYCSHPLLVREVTGRDPREDPSAWRNFYDAIEMDIVWFTNDGPPAKGRRTSMGHSIFQQDGVDLDRGVHCPFKSPEEVLSFDPVEEYGLPDEEERAAYFQSLYEQGQNSYPGQVHPGGYYKTLFSACIDTFGWDMFLSAAPLDYERFDRVLEGFFRITLPNCRAWARTSIPFFICHDDIVWTSGPVFHPEWYRRYVFPRYARLWEPLKEAGKKVLFCSDGDFTMFVDDLARAGADGFIFEPLTSLEQIAGRYGSTKVIIGNADTRILTFGSREEIRREVERCLAAGKPCPGFVMAVGNHIPHNVPIENALYYFELVRQLGRR